MACSVCEHCHVPVLMRDEIAIREGFSYHKKCHKCYVCSETNLHNAEVFKGVIFCSSCAQRIFQGCASVRKTKQQINNRAKHSRSHSRRKREKIRTQEKRIDREINGVIELAQLAGSTSGSCATVPSKKFIFKSSKETTMAMPVQVEQLGYDFQHKKSLKAISLEMGTTTVVTQKLLNLINEPDIMPFDKSISPKVISKVPVASPQMHIPPVRHRKKKKDIVPPRTNKEIVSDLRIAELGMSTEIANMALRKKSELPVIIKSDSRNKQISSDSPSILNQESVESTDEQPWVDSIYSSRNAKKKSCLDRRIGSIIKMPYKFFKKNILARSSLISIAMSSSDDNKLLKRIKTLFHEEIAEHQGRGITRLYSTINRRKTPYRLGWLHLVANVSKALYEQNRSTKEVPEERESSSLKKTPKQPERSSQTPINLKSSSLKKTPKKPSSNMSNRNYNENITKPCKHFQVSHSYRCMRAQAMRLAGPTPSQLAIIRQKIKKFIAPICVRRVARGFYNVERTNKEVQPKKCDLETVFKATPIRKPAGNTWGNIGKAYVHLWTAVV